MLNDINNDIKEVNIRKIEHFFLDYLKNIKYKGIFGIANFSSVHNNLIPEQQEKLRILLQAQFDDFLKLGSIISLGIFYHPEIIECINLVNDGKIDKESWNKYANEYEYLNKLLKDISNKIAFKFNGIAIPPTTGTPSANVNNVIDYFPKTISHRLVAEYAGIGWRGKNELLITEQFGPALRLVSILINIPLIQGNRIESKCGSCRACLDVCHILKNKNNLEDYRENCRKYLVALGLNHDVCGKCIKTCIKKGIFKDTFGIYQRD
ncbi:MAG: epoxyqueuosine reductase [Candidatus Lokiarchaeota archaeon]|nr:epoxyqueuosine reductase [Candidatus Lokiarchaeota archaeon]